MAPLRSEITEPKDYSARLTAHGQMERIEERTDKTLALKPDWEGSPIYAGLG